VNDLKLSELRPGNSGIITGICSATTIGRRLMELGFVPGAIVEVLRRAPFSGPIQYRIQGVSLSMREAEAGCVTVNPVSAAALALT
jgi:ferrous iron transport protein A